MLDFIKEVLTRFFILIALIILCFAIGLFIDVIVSIALRIGGIIFMVVVLLILASMLLTLMDR